MRELIPLKYGVQEVASSMGVEQNHTVVKITVWEYNTSALALTRVEPPRMTPRCCHYAVKYHCSGSMLFLRTLN